MTDICIVLRISSFVPSQRKRRFPSTCGSSMLRLATSLSQLGWASAVPEAGRGGRAEGTPFVLDLCHQVSPLLGPIPLNSHSGVFWSQDSLCTLTND